MSNTIKYFLKNNIENKILEDLEKGKHMLTSINISNNNIEYKVFINEEEHSNSKTFGKAFDLYEKI